MACQFNSAEVVPINQIDLLCKMLLT
jgi:hypothetical protein